jgi:hypothetical protein
VSIPGSPEITLTKPAGQALILILDATVSDDGLPEEPGVLTLKWTTKGPTGGVVLSPANSDVAEAKFTQKGRYEIELEASDGVAKTVEKIVVNVV